MSCLYCGKSPPLSFLKRSRFCSPEHEQLWHEQESQLVKRLIEATVPDAPAVPLSSLIRRPEAPAPPATSGKPAVPTTSQPESEKSAFVASNVEEAKAPEGPIPPKAGFIAPRYADIDLRKHLTLASTTTVIPAWTQGLARPSREDTPPGGEGLPRLPQCRVAGSKKFAAVPAIPAISTCDAKRVVHDDERLRLNPPKWNVLYKVRPFEPRGREFHVVESPRTLVPSRASVAEGQTICRSAVTPGQRPYVTQGRQSGHKFESQTYKLASQIGLTPLGLDRAHGARRPKTSQAASTVTGRARQALPSAPFLKLATVQESPAVSRPAVSTAHAETVLPAIAMRNTARALPTVRESTELRRVVLAASPVLETLHRHTATKGPHLSLHRGMNLRRFNLTPTKPVSSTWEPRSDKSGETQSVYLPAREFVSRALSIERRKCLLNSVGGPVMTQSPQVNPGKSGQVNRTVSEQRLSLAAPRRLDVRKLATGKIVPSEILAVLDATPVQTIVAVRAAVENLIPRLFTTPGRAVKRQPSVARYPHAPEINLAQAPLSTLGVLGVVREASEQKSLGTPRRVYDRILTARVYPRAELIDLIQAVGDDVLRTYTTRAAGSDRAPLLAMPGRTAGRQLAAGQYRQEAQFVLMQIARPDTLLTIQASGPRSLQAVSALATRASERKLAAGEQLPSAPFDLARTARRDKFFAVFKTPRVLGTLSGRIRQSPLNTTFVAMATTQCAPIGSPTAVSAWISRTTEPLLARRPDANTLAHAEPASLCREPGELFSPTVYIHGLVLPNPDRIALKGHRLLQLPKCRRVESTRFATISATGAMLVSTLGHSEGAEQKLRGNLPERGFVETRFPIARRTFGFPAGALAALTPQGLALDQEKFENPLNPVRMETTAAHSEKLVMTGRIAGRTLDIPEYLRGTQIIPAQVAGSEPRTSQKILRVRGELPERLRRALPNSAFLALAREQDPPVVRGGAAGAWNKRETALSIAPRTLARNLHSASARPLYILLDGFPTLADAPNLTLIDQGVLSRPVPSAHPGALASRDANLRSAEAVPALWRAQSAIENPKTISSVETRPVLRNPISASYPPALGVHADRQIPLAHFAGVWRNASLLNDPKTSPIDLPLLIDAGCKLPDPVRPALPRRSLGRPNLALPTLIAGLPAAGVRGLEIKASQKRLSVELALRPRGPVADTEIVTGITIFPGSFGNMPARDSGPSWQPFRVAAIGAPCLPGTPAVRPPVQALANAEGDDANTAGELIKASARMFGSPPPENEPSCELAWLPWKVTRGY